MADEIGPCQKERSKICFGKDLQRNGRKFHYCLCPYGEKLNTHKGDGHFFPIFCHGPAPHRHISRNFEFNSQWVKMVHNPKKITFLTKIQNPINKKSDVSEEEILLLPTFCMVIQILGWQWFFPSKLFGQQQFLPSNFFDNCVFL